MTHLGDRLRDIGRTQTAALRGLPSPCHQGSELADPGCRTPHAGACRTPNANSRFYGLSAATNGLVPATRAQLSSIVTTCVALFRHNGWHAADVSARIRGHDTEAIWTPALTRAAGLRDADSRPLWGHLGRKVDPTGCRNDRRPIVDINLVRLGVAGLLNALGGKNGNR